MKLNKLYILIIIFSLSISQDDAPEDNFAPKEKKRKWFFFKKKDKAKQSEEVTEESEEATEEKKGLFKRKKKKAKTKEKVDSKNTIGDANEQLKELKDKMDGK